MTFSPSQHSALIAKINAKIPMVRAQIMHLHQTASSTANAWYLPPGMGHLIMECVDEFIKAVESAITITEELLEGALVPIAMWENAYKWEDVRGVATGVAGEVTVAALGSTKDWTGASATAYTQAIAPQSAAASRLGTVADKTATALDICAAGGTAFYVAIAALLVQLATATTVVTVATATGVGAAPAAATETVLVGVTATMIGAAVTALLILVGVQATQMTSIHGETVDTTAFPGGHWPKSAHV